MTEVADGTLKHVFPKDMQHSKRRNMSNEQSRLPVRGTYIFDSLSEEARTKLMNALRIEGGNVYIFENLSRAFWYASGGVAALWVVVFGVLVKSWNAILIGAASAIALWVLIAFGVVVRSIIHTRGRPFAPGIYIAGCQLIDARGQKIKAYSLLEQSKVSVVHEHNSNGVYLWSHVHVWIDGDKHRFKLRSHHRKAGTDQSLERFVDSLNALRERVANGEREALAAYDYFGSGSNTQESHQAKPPQVPKQPTSYSYKIIDGYVNLKIVYFGPGMVGKGTNLRVIHDRLPPGTKSEITELASETDRALSFDFVPPDLGQVRGCLVRLHLHTTTGHAFYDPIWTQLLDGVSGIVFVADSRETRDDSNTEAMDRLRHLLQATGRSLETIPHVFQYGKRDLVDEIHPVAELNRMLNPTGRPAIEAVATQGVGVMDTLKWLTKDVLTEFKTAR
jgi:mutual gliding-motility protein MglA